MKSPSGRGISAVMCSPRAQVKATHRKECKPRSVACPQCGAGTNETCLTQAGTPARTVHTSRRRMAIRAVNEANGLTR